MVSCGSTVVNALHYKLQGRRLETQEVNDFYQFTEALVPGLYSGSNRNKNVSGSRVQLVHEAHSHTTICESTV